MPFVSIVEVGSDADLPANDASRPRCFQVTNRSVKHGLRQKTFEISATPLDLMNEIQWYLEDFARQSPLETKRADRAKTSMRYLGSTLVRSIDWPLIIERDERKESLILSIQEQPSSQAPILWELLEDSELWDQPFEDGVFVSRYIDAPKMTPSTTPERTPETGPTLNILVVAVRPFEEKDIPPRIVSKILQNKIGKQPDQLIRPTSFKILRPPTWEELKGELETKGAGFYDIVHLDMHGVRMDDGRQGLAFVEKGTHSRTDKPDRPGQYTMQKVSASDVAAVLALHKVRRVVINACRSAQYQDADKSIALEILRSGAEECIAMTLNVLSRAVEIFMSIFYDAVLTKGLGFDAAAGWARQALRLKPARTSRYATNVSVYDYMIPIYFTTTPPKAADAFTFKGRSLQFPRKAPFGDLVGRENDIMSMETYLLLSDQAPFLLGRPGVGKTALLNHLSSWWKETGLVTGAYIHDCKALSKLPLVDLWRGVLNQIDPNAYYGGPDAIVEFLQKNRWIIVLENLPASPGRSCLKFVAQVLIKLRGSSTKVILSARSIVDSKWGSLDQYTGMRHELKGLDMFNSLQLLRAYMKKAIADITQEEPKTEVESPQDLRCLEQITRLLDGNPAALRVIVSVFLFSKATTMTEFLEMLVLGEPLMDYDAAQTHLLSISRVDNAPCVDEFIKITRDLLFPPPGQYSVPIEVLALFWGVLPRGDLSTFVGAYADAVSNDMFSGMNPDDKKNIFKTMLGQGGNLDALALPPELKKSFIDAGQHPGNWMKSGGMNELLTKAIQETPESDSSRPSRSHFLLKNFDDYAQVIKNSALSPHFESAINRIVDPLLAAGFLTTDCQPSPNRSTTLYYRIHPLVPILLRASPLYYFTQGIGIKPIHIKQAFVFYHAYRARKWPFEHQYFEPHWLPIREELSVEFTNFTSASAMGSEMVRAMPAVNSESIAPFALVTTLQRGVGMEFSRFQLVHIAQEKAIACALWQEKKIAESGTLDEEQKQLLFILRLHGSMAAMARAVTPGPVTSEENKPFAALAGEIYARMRGMGGGFIQDKMKELDLGAGTVNYTDALFSGISKDPEGLLNKPEGLDELWKLRVGFMQESAATTGDTLYASHTSWEDVPRQLLSGSRLRMDMTKAVDKAYEAMEGGRLDEARKIVDKAWEDEVFMRTDDGLNRAQLLDLRAKICQLDGDWESAVEHQKEAEEVRRGLAREAPKDVLTVLGAPAQEGLVENLLRKLTTSAMGWLG
ncbi:hypothetical protein OQA88_5507 [Cercophora sp. LCS_1]